MANDHRDNERIQRLLREVLRVAIQEAYVPIEITVLMTMDLDPKEAIVAAYLIGKNELEYPKDEVV